MITGIQIKHKGYVKVIDNDLGEINRWYTLRRFLPFAQRKFSFTNTNVACLRRTIKNKMHSRLCINRLIIKIN